MLLSKTILRKISKLSVLIFTAYAVLLCSGCAVGQKLNYSGIAANLAVSGSKAVGVASLDRRPYVLSGEKNPDYAGTMRGGYGNPFNVGTESGQTLADDMTQVIAAALTRKGFKTRSVVTTNKDNSDVVIEKLKTTGGDNLILLTINDWKSDFAGFVAFRVWLDYDATLRVFEKSGKIIAETAIKGNDDLGSAGEPVGYTKKVVPEAFQRKIEELLNNPEVMKALQQ